jgi:hypothetical protein
VRAALRRLEPAFRQLEMPLTAARQRRVLEGCLPLVAAALLRVGAPACLLRAAAIRAPRAALPSRRS